VCSVGTAGAPGATGATGQQGLTGATGPQGPAGIAPHYANVVVVAKSGGDFTDPVAAVNSITDASENNPYLIKIMPGIYNIDAQTIFLPQYIDIEGCGSNITKIISSGENSLLRVAADSVIRDISLEGPSFTVWSDTGCSFKNTTIRGGNAVVGVNGTTYIDDSVIIASHNWPGNAVTIYNDATVRINNSRIKGENVDTVTNNNNGITYISNTMIEMSGFSNPSVGAKCFNVFNENLDPICQY
ncbi:MAG: hypothetical protein WA003_04420, partial [Desulfuromonadaceae bacterium]